MQTKATDTNSLHANLSDVHGSKGNVLLIHGMWCRGNHLSQVQEFLEKEGYTCKSIDLPLHEQGADLRKLSKLGISDYIDYLENTLDQLGWKEPILLGHSLGGLLAQLLATRIKAKALILITTVQPLQISGLSWTGLKTVWEILRTPFFWRRTNLLSKNKFAYGIYNTLSESEQNELYPTYLPESGKIAFQAFLPFLTFSQPTRVDFKKVQCPVFVAATGKDRVTPPRIGRKIASKYTNSIMKLYPKLSHWAITEDGIEKILLDATSWIEAKTRSAG
ncbi:alpha/beta fold hydrolase [Leptospira sarikeiensis]|uniref:Alpha/beta hydrolase n=1 Tax=Leptospira sarikeiensis TaxID=2484943 RepID=A0A4R9K9X5_9LEPT|nr:alpha/beta hydrolase [Leptospira sarikeiensis]TGL62795.1 alpha/beta hydrolase [Leptospira sarikeiensis]